MKINHIISGALLTLVSFSGCDSDSVFLKETPETFYTLDNVFSTSEQVKSAVTSLYSHVRNMGFVDESSLTLLRGNGTDVMDVPTIRIASALSDYTKLNAENGVIYTNYSHWYQLIAKAQTALYGASLSHITWTTEAEKNYAIAQARFFRAYAYLNLGELFGGVPIIDELITEPRFDFRRSTRLETYDFAIKDFEEILADLPEKTPAAGRLVKGAAQHFLSELYLAKGVEQEQSGTGNATESYAKSVEYASKVIDGGTYRLMTTRFGARADEPDKSVYWDLFRDGNIDYQQGNMESIWAIQVDFESYLAEDKDSRLPYARVFSPVLRDLTGLNADGTTYRPFLNAYEDGGGRGISVVTPTYYTRDIIWEGKFGNDMRNSSHNIIRTFYCNNPDLPDLYGKPIPESILNMDDKAKTIAYPIFFKLTTDRFVGLEQGENMSNLFRDDYVIRLAETILLRAEAYLRLGRTQDAAADINKLRERAECEFLVSAGDVTIDLILDERTRELYGEEHRWNTLLRMGGTVAVDRIKKYAYWKETVKATLNFTYNLWPIPQQIIDRNKDIPMEQNPGWR